MNNDISVSNQTEPSAEYLKLYHKHVLDGIYKQNMFKKHVFGPGSGSSWSFSSSPSNPLFGKFGVGNKDYYEAELLGTTSENGSWMWSNVNPTFPPEISQFTAQLRSKLAHVPEFEHDILFINLADPHVLAMIALGELDAPAYFFGNVVILIRSKDYPELMPDINEMRQALTEVATGLPMIRLTPELIDRFMKKYGAEVVVEGDKRTYKFQKRVSNVFVKFENGRLKKVGGLMVDWRRLEGLWDVKIDGPTSWTKKWNDDVAQIVIVSRPNSTRPMWATKVCV